MRADKNSTLIHRTDILAGIKALYVAQSRVDHLLKEDSYSCGYKEGFENALLSLAELLGVVDEYRQAQPRLKRMEMGRISVVSGPSSG